MDEILRTLGVILGHIATAFGIIKVWKEATVASSSQRVDALKAAADEWREIKDDYRERLVNVEEAALAKDRHYEETFREQQVQIDKLRGDVASLKETEGRLVGWVARLHKGIMEGSIPPLPEIPSWLTNLLNRKPPAP